MKKLRILNVLVGLLVLASTAYAEDRLRLISEKSTITLGFRDASLPFSYLSETQKPIGYSMDICHGIVKAVEKSVGKTLHVELVPVTSSTRMPLIANGTIDLECGSTGNTLARQKQVSFAPTTFVVANHYVVKKSSAIHHLADLQNKTVVSTAGTNNIKWLTEENRRRKLGLKIIVAKDHADGFLMVNQGRATAFFMDNVLLAGLVATSHHPEDWVIGQEAYNIEPYAMILPKDDPEFKKVVDAAVIAMIQDGTVEKLYNKWFLAPVPPKNVNLNLPMSVALKKVMAQPTDSSDPAHYQEG